ncbi:peptidoglycan-recognition protein SB1-like [Zophobas morio]|uniref:peptidoglycan-recognition protein SB1-like n=1 Tax=Zophobas morio TaxID=2755281 RepID=UPI0030829CE7
MFFSIFLLAILPYIAHCACPTIISRSDWGARAPRQRTNLREVPPPYVVVHHTEDPVVCTTKDACKRKVKNIQNYHMDDPKHRWDDIGYNFLIGGDGNVYEGRGWGRFGSHARRFNGKSIGIALIGAFTNTTPSQTQLNALKDLLACGTEKNYIRSNYHMIGHRQEKDTSCPGDRLYNEISTWPHFDSSIRPH